MEVEDMDAPQRNPWRQLAYMIRLYGFYLVLYFRTLVEYRTDTIITLITSLLTQIGALAFIGLLFQKLPQLAGWDLNELLFLFGISVSARSFCEVFLNVTYRIQSLVRTGRLDIFMIRPAGTLFQAVGVSQEINGLGSAIFAVAVMIYAGVRTHLVWDAGQVAYLLLTILCGALIYYCVLMTVSITAFWFIEVRSALMPIAWLFEFTRYPLEIFHPVIRGLLTYIFPYALGTFFPAVYLLRPGSCPWILWGMPLFTLAFVTAVYGFWRVALQHYSSASG
jgi:ABC-2 type transport system permease protein